MASARLASSSPGDTERVGGSIALELGSGDIVTIGGELGSGKTTLVRGACRALGVTGPVTSPTYTIGHRYPRAGGGPDVSHLDLYRFGGVSPAEWGDLEPYFEDAICFVEWPEAAGTALADARLGITLGHAGPSERTMALRSADPDLLRRLLDRARARV